MYFRPMKKLVLIAILIALAAPALPTPSFAFQEDQDRALELRKNRDVIPYGRIVNIAQKEFGGRVVGQKLREVGGVMVYELRILKPDGKVVQATYNAKTGRLISQRGGK